MHFEPFFPPPPLSQCENKCILNVFNLHVYPLSASLIILFDSPVSLSWRKYSVLLQPKSINVLQEPFFGLRNGSQLRWLATHFFSGCHRPPAIYLKNYSFSIFSSCTLYKTNKGCNFFQKSAKLARSIVKCLHRVDVANEWLYDTH
jgi:hypothetical protein